MITDKKEYIHNMLCSVRVLLIASHTEVVKNRISEILKLTNDPDIKTINKTLLDSNYSKSLILVNKKLNKLFASVKK